MTIYRRKPLDIEAWEVDELLETAARDTTALPEPVLKAYEAGKLAFMKQGIGIEDASLGDAFATANSMLCLVPPGVWRPYGRDNLEALYEPADERSGGLSGK